MGLNSMHVKVNYGTLSRCSERKWDRILYFLRQTKVYSLDAMIENRTKVYASKGKLNYIPNLSELQGPNRQERSLNDTIT